MFKLTPVKNYEEVIGRFYNRTKNYIVLDDFLNSGEKCCLYEGWTAADAGSAASSLLQSAHRYHLDLIDVVSRGDKVYIIRKDV